MANYYESVGLFIATLVFQDEVLALVKENRSQLPTSQNSSGTGCGPVSPLLSGLICSPVFMLQIRVTERVKKFDPNISHPKHRIFVFWLSLKHLACEGLRSICSDENNWRDITPPQPLRRHDCRSRSFSGLRVNRIATWAPSWLHGIIRFSDRQRKPWLFKLQLAG